MRSQSPFVEVNFLSARDVERYALRQPQSAEDREAVEQLLIDDDRARKLVAALATPCADEELTDSFIAQVSEAIDACRNALAHYELLIQCHGPETLIEFAMDRFGARWAWLSVLSRMAPDSATHSFLRFRLPGFTTFNASKEQILQRAGDSDDILHVSLEKTFAAASGPAEKATLSNLIDALSMDRRRVAWLGHALR